MRNGKLKIIQKHIRKHSNLTDISMNLDFFKISLTISRQTKKKIFLSTGSVNTSMIERIKVNAVKINEFV